MSERTNVLFFSIHSGVEFYGGSSKMLFRLLKGFDKQQFRPILLTRGESELTTRIEEHGLDVDIEIIPFRGVLNTYNRQLISSPLLVPPTLFRLAQFNSEAYSVVNKSDIIWCQDLRAVLTLFPYIFISQTPTIWNIGLGMTSDGIVKNLQHLSLHTVDHVFIESKTQAQLVFQNALYSKYEDKFTIFSKGIDVEKFDPDRFADNDERLGYHIGTACSLTPRKGLEFLIEAMPEIYKEHNITLSIAGETTSQNEEYATTLKQKVSEYDIENRVEFYGWVEDMPAYLSSLDVFVLPSLNEGIPGAVREALAMEIPVVATDVGGTSEVVHDNETGILIEPEDPDAIADAIDYLLSNPEIRAKMGARGRELIVSEFSIESYVANYEAFLKCIATN